MQVRDEGLQSAAQAVDERLEREREKIDWLASVGTKVGTPELVHE